MASRGINKVILVGNLGQDPDVRFSPKGTVIANLSIATGEAWKDQQGQLQERTEWHRIVMHGKSAEIARDYLRKGSKVYLEGRLQTRKWQDKQGVDHYTTEIISQEFQMLDRRPGDDAPRPAAAPRGPAPTAALFLADIPFDDYLPF